MQIRGLILMLAGGLAVAGCRKKSAPAAAAAPADAAASAAAPEPGPAPAEAAPVAVITSVHPQWIISDSQPKVEITLFGENLARDARVTARSSQMRVESIDSDPGRAQVVVAVEAGTPPGNYEFQYEAPGQQAIPFTVQYNAPR